MVFSAFCRFTPRTTPHLLLLTFEVRLKSALRVAGDFPPPSPLEGPLEPDLENPKELSRLEVFLNAAALEAAPGEARVCPLPPPLPPPSLTLGLDMER